MKQKQRFSLRKNKIGTASVLLGLTILGGASYASGEVHAAEVPIGSTTDSSAEVTQPTTAKKVSDQQVLDAKKNVDDKNTEISSVQKDVNKVKEEVADKTDSKEKLNVEKNKLTKDVEEAKNTTPADVAKIEDSINVQKQNKVDKTKELEQAKINESAKQATAQEKAKDVEKAQENVTKADKDVEAKKQALDPKAEEIAKDNAAKATADLANKEVKQNEAKADLDAAKAFDADLSEKKVAANINLADKIKAKEERDNDVIKATKSQKAAQSALENAFPYPTRILTSPEWIKAFKEYKLIYDTKFDYKGWREVNPQKPDEDTDEYEKRYSAASDAFYDKWRIDEAAAKKKLIEAEKSIKENDLSVIRNYVNEKDNSEVYDINNIPTDVLVDASQYFAHLVNTTRIELGITEKIKVHRDAVEYASDVAKSVVDNNIKTFGHYYSGLKDAARKRGLKSSATENLAGSNFKGQRITRQELFHEIYLAANLFFHEGPMNRHYNHALSLLRNVNVGVALSQVEGADYMQVHAISIPPTIVTDGSYEDKYGSTLLPNVVYEDKNVLEAKLNKENINLANAKNALTIANKELATAQLKVSELNKIKTQTPEAQAKYNKAVADVQKASDAKVKAEQRLQFVTLNKVAKENALNEALKSQKEAKIELAKARSLSDKAIRDYNNAVNARVSKELEISNITKKIDELVNKKVEIENKIAKRAENEARLIEIDKELTKLTDEITNLTAEEVKLKTTISTLEKQLVDLENEYERLLNIYTTERVPKAPIVEDLPSIDIQESTHTEDIEYRTIEKEDITIPVGEK